MLGLTKEGDVLPFLDAARHRRVPVVPLADGLQSEQLAVDAAVQKRLPPKRGILRPERVSGERRGGRLDIRRFHGPVAQSRNGAAGRGQFRGGRARRDPEQKNRYGDSESSRAQGHGVVGACMGGRATGPGRAIRETPGSHRKFMLELPEAASGPR